MHTNPRGSIIIGLALLLVFIAHVAAAQDPSLVTEQNETTLLLTSIIGFASILVTQLFGMWRENQRDRAKRKEAERQRQWDLEDRATARAEMKRDAQLQRVETIQTAIELARVTSEHREHIVREISQNTEITKAVGAKAEEAYKAANDFTARLDKLRAELRSKGPQIDHIEKVSDETKDIVTELKAGTNESGGTNPGS